MNRLKDIAGHKILIIGDLMLDNYHIGKVSRISPEAPVPVVRVKKSFSVPGGAANVARNLIGLECYPILIGFIGDDFEGETLINLLQKDKIECHVIKNKHNTISKTRVIGNNQQIVRIDFEENISLEDEAFSELKNRIGEYMKGIDIIVISDYDKGVCSPEICTFILEEAKKIGKKVIIDPKGNNWDKYRNAFMVTPNVKELSDVYGREIKNDDLSIKISATEIVDKFDIENLIVTRSEKGMTLISHGFSYNIPTEAKEVYDVSGAGDTAVATLSAAIAGGRNIIDAIKLANKASGIVVSKIGTQPVTLKELSSEIEGSRNAKLIDYSEIEGFCESLKRNGKKIVFTNGCFDVIHAGHISYLKEAKKLGDVLIVGLNSDGSVKSNKGPTRPINGQEARLEVMSALQYVDYIVIFDDKTPYDLISKVSPDFLVKGGDYKIEDIVGREFAKKVCTIAFKDGFSSTSIIKKMSLK